MNQVIDSDSWTYAVMRKRASGSLMAYLMARQEIQSKIDELAEEKLGPGGKERLLATLVSQDKQRSMEEMIADSARTIFQEYFDMLFQSPIEEEEEEEEEAIEEEEEEAEEEEEEEEEEEGEEEEYDEEVRMTAQVSLLCKQISGLIVELLKMVPEEDTETTMASLTAKLNRIDCISESIQNFVLEIDGRLRREKALKEKEELERLCQQDKKREEEEKKHEQERNLNKEIDGQVVVAGGGFATMDMSLEGKDIESEAVVIDEDAAAAAQIEEEAFACFRTGWERRNGGKNFEDLTLLSSMLFTHCTPGFKPVDAVLARTVQICSIKITDVKHFKWPLQVYGVVAARDVVDGCRNPIFLCPRDGCQILNEADPFLHLTGPVRAIVSEEPVDIEIQLIIKGKTASEDTALVSYAFLYDCDAGHFGDSFRTSIIEKNFCTLELCSQRLKNSVQATIFGVHVVDEKLTPFQYGVRVVCYSLSEHDMEEVNVSKSRKIVLLDSKAGRKCAVKRGYLNLSRQVLSVEFRGKLKVCIQAYTPTGDIAAQGNVFVVPKIYNTTEHVCELGGFKVEFTVAWSLLVEDDEHILMNGCVDPLAFCPPMKRSFQ